MNSFATLNTDTHHNQDQTAMIRRLSAEQLLQRYDLDYFKEASSLGALTDEAISFLFREGDLMEMDSGDHLFNLGDPGDSFFIIMDGSVALYRPGSRGMTHIRDYGYGMELGFVAMIGLHDRLGDAVVNEPSVVLKVSCHLFSQLQVELPNDFGVMLLNLSREMSRRLRDADARLADFE